MTANTVVDALVAWFEPPAITGLHKLADGDPYFDGDPAWRVDEALGWGASGFVWLVHSSEHRIAMGGPTSGLKQVAYDAGIWVVFQYQYDPQAFDPATSPTAYRRPLYGLGDDLKARLRADRTIGTGGTTGAGIGPDGAILQVGEGDGTGGEDIVLDYDLPRRDAGSGRVWSRLLLQFKVVEIAAA